MPSLLVRNRNGQILSLGDYRSAVKAASYKAVYSRPTEEEYLSQLFFSIRDLAKVYQQLPGTPEKAAVCGLPSYLPAIYGHVALRNSLYLRLHVRYLRQWSNWGRDSTQGADQDGVSGEESFTADIYRAPFN